MATKTNAIRIVNHAGIACLEAFYEYDEQDLSGMHAAKAIIIASDNKIAIIFFINIPPDFDYDIIL